MWQAEDTATRDAARAVQSEGILPLEILHNPERGIVPAENLALHAAPGEIVFLIDDDAVAPSDWIERHVRHYRDASVGAVGGPADNFHPDGRPFPKRAVLPTGRLAWFGRMSGNMYDHANEWRKRTPSDVGHPVGYNMSLRRKAFDRFEARPKPYWQSFELDTCLKVRTRGYRVVFDFANVVEHLPTNTAYEGGRHGDLEVKVYNAAYNYAFILSKHTRGLLRPIRLLFLLFVGNQQHLA